MRGRHCAAANNFGIDKMSAGRTSLSIMLSVSLAACGGGGSSGGGPIGGGAPTPTPTATTASCSLSSRQDFAKSVIDKWFLYPSKVDSTVNKANYSTIQAYIDAVLRPFFTDVKNAQFTYITSIKEEDAYYSSGSVTVLACGSHTTRRRTASL